MAHAAVKRLESHIRDWMRDEHIPDVAACGVKDGKVAWADAFGFATMVPGRRMTLDSVENIGSISKTFCTLALMPLVEQGRVDLDANVERYPPFPLRNPHCPAMEIRVRDLLVHCSSLRDGTWYSKLYRCGDPQLKLGDWLRAYFLPGGTYYSAEENFQTAGPGTQWEYCNLAYGLVACIVEAVCGENFPSYCDREIFQPLGLGQTSWYLVDIDPRRHAPPYSWVAQGEVRGPAYGGIAQGVIRESGPTLTSPQSDGFHSNCLYSHPNYPDGFLRSSAPPT